MTSREPNPQFTVSYPHSEKKTLKREIKRTWEWIVFAWNNLKRIGGIREIISTLVFSMAILLQRAAKQQRYKRYQRSQKKV